MKKVFTIIGTALTCVVIILALALLVALLISLNIRLWGAM